MPPSAMRHPGDPELNRITGEILDAALRVHSELGPGLFESVYQAYLSDELGLRGLAVQREVPIELTRQGRILGLAYRADLVVEGRVLVEVKAVARLEPIHWVQVQTYLRMGGFPVGFLLNFHERAMIHGTHRIVRADR